ncbi:MAG: nucleotidyltransferase domain-containing protein [Victivallaceae bacterium]
MLAREVEQIKDIIVKDYHPDKIILFGSYARGDNTPDSDIDLLVLSDREENLPRPKRGLAVRLKLAGIHTPMDLLFLSHSEYSKYQGVRQSFNATIAVIYGQ